MALQFNSFLRGGTAIPYIFMYHLGLTQAGLRVYPSTVPFPTSAPTDFSTLPAGWMLLYTGFSTTMSGSTIIFNGAPGTTATALSTGTPSWMAWYSNSTSDSILLTDSVGLTSGNDTILGLSSMAVTSGNVISATLNMQFV